MALNKTNRGQTDAPIPIDIRDTPENNFYKIKKNIDFLWQRLKENGDTVINIGSRRSGTPSSGGGGGPTPVIPKDAFMHSYNPSGGTSVSATKVDLTLTKNARLDSSFSHTLGSAEITILKEADYEIDVDAGFGLNEGDYIEIALLVDDGTGYVEVPGSLANCGA